jgi:Subtilisin inhibitor-like
MAMTPLSDEVRSQSPLPVNRAPLSIRAALSRQAVAIRAAGVSRGVLVSRRALAHGSAVAACALLAAACGSTVAPSSGAGASSAGHSSSVNSSSAGSNSAGTSSAGTDSAAKVSLDVSFAPSPTSPARYYTLRCEPAGGTAPDPAAACAKLLAGPSIFAPLPAHMLCPMILAGAARATITGTYLGKPVHADIYDGGCDLGRWAKLKAVFGYQ